jgi:penicillin-binding protein 2
VLLRLSNHALVTVFRVSSDLYGCVRELLMTTRTLSFFPILTVLALFTGIVFASTTSEAPTSLARKKKKKKKSVPKPAVAAVSAKPATTKITSQGARLVRTTATTSPSKSSTRRRRPVFSPWDEPTYADSTVGDNVDGEDLDVRRAAVEALGPLNGSVVVSDPDTGRILAMVNQKLALSDGYQPCSTVKVPVAFAALSEGLVDRNTMMPIYGRTKMNLTQALAKSNNQYFAKLGEQLGYEKFSYYAHLFGLGEKAGLDIPGEHSGHFPAEPPKNGGMGMLTSFGEEISLTPLQLAAIMGSIANGGTLYYLQHPRSQQDIANFVPRIKRRLDIENQIPEVQPGMRGAVQYGTARRILALTEDPIMGKTGTCSDRRTHLGWFGSFSEIKGKRVVVAVLLTGGRPCVGPAAAGVAGGVYKRLSEQRFFSAKSVNSPAAFVPPAGPVRIGY